MLFRRHLFYFSACRNLQVREMILLQIWIFLDVRSLISSSIGTIRVEPEVAFMLVEHRQGRVANVLGDRYLSGMVIQLSISSPNIKTGQGPSARHLAKDQGDREQNQEPTLPASHQDALVIKDYKNAGKLSGL